MKLKLLISTFSIVVLMMSSVLVMAQAPLPGDPGDVPPAPAPLPEDPVDVPVDGGLSVLLAAGVGYSVKKLNDKRKKKSSETADGIVEK